MPATLTMEETHLVPRDEFTAANFADGGRYKLRSLTTADVQRAADIVAAIGAIPTLREGVVGFGYHLEGGEWFFDKEEAGRVDRNMVATIPADLSQCYAAVIAGLEPARRDMAEYGASSGHPRDELHFELARRSFEIEDAPSLETVA